MPESVEKKMFELALYTPTLRNVMNQIADKWKQLCRNVDSLFLCHSRLDAKMTMTLSTDDGKTVFDCHIPSIHVVISSSPELTEYIETHQTAHNMTGDLKLFRAWERFGRTLVRECDFYRLKIESDIALTVSVSGDGMHVYADYHYESDAF